MAQSKVAIIGAGRVGSTIAYALLLRNIAAQIMLVDINKDLCQGEVEDLSDVLSFSTTSSISHATLEEAAQADIIIIAAGRAQESTQDRLALVRANGAIAKSIIASLKNINPQVIIIVVANPVDIITRLVQESGILPRNQIFGSGTMLDTQRLRGYISRKIAVAEQSVHVYILGEHGDSQFVAWSDADIGGMPIEQFPGLNQDILDDMAKQARQKAYEIIACKGSTYYGVATCVWAYCESILFNQRRIMPVSWWVESLNCTLSMPCVIGRNGVEQIVDIPLTAKEQQQLQSSVQILSKIYDELSGS
ncbi:MAG: L-lactate dehydrogenase [Candidatus Babeliales bacterium]